MTTSNGTVHASKPMRGGIYAPIPTPLHADETLDLATLAQHALRLARAEVGLVVGGSTGEASQLTRQERYEIVATVRKALIQENLDCPVVAGTGGGSLRETLELCQDAKRAGADAVLVIAPGYFSGAIAKDAKALQEFFWETADKSPLPVMIYNFPGASAGIDLDSDLLEAIAAHPNICGAKLTCGGIGKGARLVSSQNVAGRAPFHVFPGFADILFPGMMVGMTGAIAGTANLVPRLVVQLYHAIVAFQQAPTPQGLAEVQKLSDVVSRADWALAKSGLSGTKWVLGRWYEDVGVPRRPLQPLSKEKQSQLQVELAEAVELERTLERAAGLSVVAKP